MTDTDRNNEKKVQEAAFAAFDDRFHYPFDGETDDAAKQKKTPKTLVNNTCLTNKLNIVAATGKAIKAEDVQTKIVSGINDDLNVALPRSDTIAKRLGDRITTSILAVYAGSYGQTMKGAFALSFSSIIFNVAWGFFQDANSDDGSTTTDKSTFNGNTIYIYYILSGYSNPARRLMAAVAGGHSTNGGVQVQHVEGHDGQAVEHIDVE